MSARCALFRHSPLHLYTYINYDERLMLIKNVNLKNVNKTINQKIYFEIQKLLLVWLREKFSKNNPIKILYVWFNLIK